MKLGRAALAGLGLLSGVALLAADRSGADVAGPGDSSNRPYLGFVSTDKPIYRDGERVYVRTIVLDAGNHKPWKEAGYPEVFQVIGPKGEMLGQGGAQIQDGAAGFAWDVPADAAGGQYKITARFPYQGFPPAVRRFEVRAYRAPRLKGEIVFLRDGYGAGDTVKASLHVERAEGGLPSGAGVSVSAIVDGANAYSGETKVDSAGNCAVEFKLPAAIEAGDGTLSLTISDGGVVEPIVKTIPILVNSVDIHFYPEGGEFVAGLSNRIYLEARTPAKKPADIKGQIINEAGQVVADVVTDHEGRGRFLFTPKDGGVYRLKLSQPAGIEKLFPLPAVISSGVTLTSAADVTGKNSAVQMQCASTSAGTYSLSLSKHDIKLSSQMFDLEAGKPVDIALSAPAWADGVLVATLRDADGKGVAERLVYREPSKSVHVKVSADKDTYVPGEGATITVTTTDDGGKPIAVMVGISATDASILEIPEQRDRAPRLAEMVLLENDVKELADSQVYFDPANSRAAEDVDLLLGTQGWRRFASEDEAKFLREFGDLGRRALANREVVATMPMSQAAFGEMIRGGGFGGGGGAEFDDTKLADRLGAAAPQSAIVAPDATGAPVWADKDTDIPQADFSLQPAEAAKSLPWNGVGGGFGGRLGPRQEDVRIYAHETRSDAQSGQRKDFAETVYWAAGVATSADTGTATVSFKLNDSVTSFKVLADAFSDSGALGEGDATVHSVKPFYIEPKLPLEVSTGDVIRLPIAVASGAGDALVVRMAIDGDSSLKFGTMGPINLPASGRMRGMTEINVGDMPGIANVKIHADAGQFTDDVIRQLAVKAVGFPTQISRGGMIEASTSIVQTIEVPDSVVKGSMTASLSLYPTPVGNLTESLRGLMREPNGCFEQTSSTTYPLVMADQYFTSHSGVDPQMISESNGLLEKGYQRLIGFECKDKGYEWFGEDPGHECLSAYALLEFTDMSGVRSVDQAMLQAVRNWLLTHRDGKGGFTHERRSLHTWITDPDCANGYCTWALLETGQKDLGAEVDWLKKNAATDTNSYAKALAANVMYLAGDTASAKEFMDVLAKRQESDGHVSGATTSVVGSEGVSLDIETTSLAALAWMRDPAYGANVTRAIQYLASCCQGGRYGSTQSTVLALRAIVQYDKISAHPTAAGKVQLKIDGHTVGDAVAFDASSQGAIKLPDFTEYLTPGKHDIELRMIDGSRLPYAMDINYNSVTPASSDRCKLDLAVSLKDSQITEGGITEANVVVTNKTDAAIPTPIAIVGIPGGLEVRYDQLKELVKAGRIAAYEVRGREVILYWRDFHASERVEIPLSLTAAVPGDYTGLASRAYLYYADENKQWVKGLKVSIAAK